MNSQTMDCKDKTFGARKLAFLFLVILLLLVTWVPRNWTLLVDTFTDQPGVFAGAILLPVLGMAVAYLWAKVWGAQVADRRTYALEIGIVNGPLAVAVIAGVFLLKFALL